MIIFSFAWMPFCYLFWRSLVGPAQEQDKNWRGFGWALVSGSLTALLYFFVDTFVSPTGFGYARWLSAFMDVIGLPVSICIFFYIFFSCFHVFHCPRDFALFSFPFFIPLTLLRSLVLNIQGSALNLVLPPVLWALFAGGAPLFITVLRNTKLTVGRLLLAFVVVLCLLALVGTLPTVWWAFYGQNSFLGWALLGGVSLPLLCNLLIKIIFQTKREGNV